MSQTRRPEGDGYAVEVSLLNLKPSALALVAACLVALFALVGWLGGDNRHLAASEPSANHAANHARRAEPAALPNSATSGTAESAPAEDKREAGTPSADSPEGDAVPGPSPAGFAEKTAENTASGTVPAISPATPEVAAAAPAPAANGATDAPSAGGFAVQTGSYNSVSEANELVSALRAAGFEARTAAVELPGRGTWHRVYSGRFASREEAAQHDGKLRVAGVVAQTIITPVQD